MTAEQERAAIVAWLRKQYQGRLQSPIWLADAIEAGEHHGGEG